MLQNSFTTVSVLTVLNTKLPRERAVRFEVWETFDGPLDGLNNFPFPSATNSGKSAGLGKSESWHLDRNTYWKTNHDPSTW